VEKNTYHNFHSFENRCNFCFFFSRWKLLLVSASKFRQLFCGKQPNVTEQIAMLIQVVARRHSLLTGASAEERDEDIKACSWCQVRRVNFTSVLTVLYFRSNRPPWTPQCPLLLVGQFCRRNAGIIMHSVEETVLIYAHSQR